MEGIRKEFPGVVALDDVDFGVRSGEVHVILGENGAGKSTLMKILSGAQRMDAGRIFLDGREVQIDGPRHARELGVAIIYQELSLAPTLSAAENVFLGREPRRLPGLVNHAAMEEASRAILDGLGARFDVRRPVRDLSLAERQLVEIARALSLDATILVMDEPTSALTDREAQALFDAMRRLIARGVAIVYISHRLQEIYDVGSRVTVLRDGRRVATLDVAGADRRELVRLMANREVDELVTRRPSPRGAELLRVEGLRRGEELRDVSFALHAGEVVGFAGLLGSGRTAVARALFGLDSLEAGRVFVSGRETRIASPRDAIRAGIGLVTEDRKRQGLVLALSVRENIALPVLRSLSRFGVVDARRERDLASRFVADLRIRTPSIDQIALNLSGGNQQKVVLAKWLACRVDILILDEPTRGIDVGAKQEIYALMERLAAEGVGIVLISSELPEIAGLCDRVLVMRAGAVAGTFARGVSQEEILACAVGMAA
jgi:ribose transport system ATP-binding protein